MWSVGIFWLAVAWLVSYSVTSFNESWLKDGGDPRDVIDMARVRAAMGVDPPSDSPRTLPRGHPPVPMSAKSLCDAGLNAAATAAAHGRSWLESPYAMAAVSVIACVVVGVRRWRIERSRASGLRPPADPRGMLLDEDDWDGEMEEDDEEDDEAEVEPGEDATGT